MGNLPEAQLNQLRDMTNQLNNYLQQISGYAQRCITLTEGVTLAQNYLQNVVNSANQAGDLAQSLLETLYGMEAIKESVAPASAAPAESEPAIRLRTDGLPNLQGNEAAQEASEPAPSPEVEAAPEQPVFPEGIAVENPGGSRELIMLVDDDDHVLVLAKMILVEADYKLITAKNGLEAITIYQQAHPFIHLVILDYAMPIMDGSEVFEELRMIDPRAIVLLSSGFTEQSKLNQMLALGLRGFLPKPYTREKMLLQVRSALDGSRV